MKATAPRIADQSADFYPTVFKSLNAGLEYILDAVPVMYQRSMERLKGPFTTNELKLIIKVFAGSKTISPALAGFQLLRYVQDGIQLNRLDKKYEVSAKTLEIKLKALSIFESACLELWAYGYSHSNEFYHFRVGLDEYVAQLAGDIDIQGQTG